MRTRTKPKPKAKMIFGQSSWEISTPQVRAYVTQTGGHVGPVSFRFGNRSVEPFSVAPWAEEDLDPRANPPVIRALRGDFFCMPFGGNATPHRGEKHPVHGESANAQWKFEDATRGAGRVSLHLSLNTRIRRGRIDKELSLIPGQHAIYSRHTILNMTGAMCLGHHAMLRFPDEPHSGLVSTSPFVFGQVFPELIERPENRGYSILKPGAEFDSLENVPTITGQTTDLGRYPDRRGFEDLVMLVSEDRRPFAWTAVTFPRERYVWFALKDPRVLRSTIFWISNGGRHYAPWSGRHVNVMGLEEVTSNFHLGLAESARPNPISRRGMPTTIKLDPRRPLVVNYIMAVAEVPRRFDHVGEIEADGDEAVRVMSRTGKSVRVPLDVGFLGAGGQSL